MTEAQLITKAMSERNEAGLLSIIAKMYVDDPLMSDTYVRELHEQTHENMLKCVSDWGQDIVDRMIKYCE